MWPYEQDARSPWRLKRNDNAEGSSQVLDAYAADRNRSGKSIAKCRAAGAGEVIDEGNEDPRARPVKVIRLLLGAPGRDYLYRYT